MAFSVDNFTSKFNNLARSYMFQCDFPVGDKSLSVIVESTSLPTKTITEVEANYMGQQVKLAGNVTYENWTCTFRMDADYTVYSVFRNWMNEIRGDGDGIVGVPGNGSRTDGYKKPIDLYQLSESTIAESRLTLYGAFPITLGEITYDTKSSDIQLFPVTFAYDYHTWVNI